MKKVDFVSVEQYGEQHVDFIVGLVDGRLDVVWGKREMARKLGVPDEPIVVLDLIDPKAEPERYLENLKYAFGGSRLWATDVYDSP
jgi:hypothetical protein